MKRALDRLDAITARLLLPLTLGGLLIGLAFSWAGNEAAATWCWAIPSLLVGVWLTISIIRDLLQRRGRRRPHRRAGHRAGRSCSASRSPRRSSPSCSRPGHGWSATRRAGPTGSSRRWSRRAPRVVHRYEDGAHRGPRHRRRSRSGDRLLVKPGEVVPVDGTRDRAPRPSSTSRRSPASRASRPARPGDPVELRHGERRRALRPPGDRHGRAQHVRRHRPPGRGGPELQGALRAPGGPLRAPLRAAHAGRRRRRLGHLGRPDPRPLRARRGDALPAPAGRPHRDRRRASAARAKRGIIVKGGGALEALARARVLLFDKTGTLTAGRPRLADVVTAPERTPRRSSPWPPRSSRSRRTCSRPRSSSGARERGVALTLPEAAAEVPGAGHHRPGRRHQGRWPGRSSSRAGARPCHRGRATCAGASASRERRASTSPRTASSSAPSSWTTRSAPRRRASSAPCGAPAFARIVMVTGDHYGVADMVGRGDRRRRGAGGAHPGRQGRCRDRRDDARRDGHPGHGR